MQIVKTSHCHSWIHQYNRRQKHKMYFTNSRLDLIKKNNFVSLFDDKSMFTYYYQY